MATSQAKRARPEPKLTYRGNTLPRLPMPSQFTSAQIKKAVDVAIAKYFEAGVKG